MNLNHATNIIELRSEIINTAKPCGLKGTKNMKLGSKIENLKTLKSAGINVPEFETFSFEELINSDEEIKKAIGKCKDKPVSEKSRVLKEAVRKSVRINKAINLSGEKFSVRSSSCV